MQNHYILQTVGVNLRFKLVCKEESELVRLAQIFAGSQLDNLDDSIAMSWNWKPYVRIHLSHLF